MRKFARYDRTVPVVSSFTMRNMVMENVVPAYFYFSSKQFARRVLSLLSSFFIRELFVHSLHPNLSSRLIVSFSVAMILCELKTST